MDDELEKSDSRQPHVTGAVPNAAGARARDPAGERGWRGFLGAVGHACVCSYTSKL